MNQMEWIKELIDSENKILESGVVDTNPEYRKQRLVVKSTLDLLLDLKARFTETTQMYNELKPTPQSKIKIYTIAQTHSDFMLFRNGYKMIFTMKEPGVIEIRFNFIGSQLISSIHSIESKVNSKIFDDQKLQLQVKPFDEVTWTFNGSEFKAEYLVKYYLNLFVRESLN
ncbi:MAG: hypothetical protein JNL11_13930 [Bdellovibrionaceae bacterium]|nr:hypothetical protein [Pseudobdellovibrionaceae bacterium]